MRWIDRLLTHSRDTAGDFGSRVVIHIPLGFLIGVTFPVSVPLLLLFIRYEENEDVHTKDQAWKDYFGALVGCALGLVTEVTLVIMLIT